MNDPVNYKDSGKGYMYPHSRTNTNKFVSNSPIFLQYPNPMADPTYDDYCGFEDYYAAEIYGAFFDGCQAIDNFDGKIHELDAINAWNRISQYLPWFEIGKSDPNWNRGWFLTHAFSPKLHNGLEDMSTELIKWTADLGSKYLTWPWNYETPNDTSWRVIKKLIDERREAGEPDFQPGENKYPVPDKFPIDHTLSPKFKTYFANGIKIKFMSGIMVNFNYPDNFDNDMFSKMECEAELTFDEVDGGYSVQVNMMIDYNVESYYNPWTDETIEMANVDPLVTINAFLPYDQIIIEEETNPNTDAVVFDIYDDVTNQVYFFDCFVETDKKEIVSAHPFGKLTTYGRPHQWLNLDSVWAPQDLIVQDFVF